MVESACKSEVASPSKRAVLLPRYTPEAEGFAADVDGAFFQFAQEQFAEIESEINRATKRFFGESASAALSMRRGSVPDRGGRRHVGWPARVLSASSGVRCSIQ